MQEEIVQSIDNLTSHDYAEAFRKISLTDKQWEMLRIHMEAPDQALTMRQMATAMGFSTWNAANIHYGRLAGNLCKQLKIFPDTKLFIMVEFFKEPGNEWVLQLRPSVVYALNELGLSSHTPSAPKQDFQSKEHFIAYHSVQKMGYDLTPDGHLRFLSKKQGLLKKAIGNIVWVMKGVPNQKGTSFSLFGLYLGSNVELENSSSERHVILGQSVKEFAPPIPLNNLDWFPSFLKSQSNFSLGFNRISDENYVQQLINLYNQSFPSTSSDLSELDLSDIDTTDTVTEGKLRLASHLKRDRDPIIIAQKKIDTLTKKGHLCCEVCNFNFAEAYGIIGDNFCEVHHLTPLSTVVDSTQTSLEDLAIVCSNCHRMIHRSDPMLSIEELSAIVGQNRT